MWLSFAQKKETEVIEEPPLLENVLASKTISPVRLDLPLQDADDVGRLSPLQLVVGLDPHLTVYASWSQFHKSVSTVIYRQKLNWVCKCDFLWPFSAFKLKDFYP
jgi:hypothetical protein